MNPYPRRVVVISGYNAKLQAWYAMDDDKRDRVGYGRTEENAWSELVALIRDREIDADDQERWEYERAEQSDQQPDGEL